MAQYKDGDSRTINGVTYVRTNGSWLPKVGSQFAAPTLPYQAPQAQADLTGKNLSNTKDAATQAADITTARNQAVSSGYAAKSAAIKVASDRADYNIKMGIPPGDLSKYGQEYIATLPPGVGDLTKEMLAGKYKGSITNTRNPVLAQAALAAAHATHGTFDAGIYDRRQTVLQQLNNPNSPLTAFNTALAHAGNLHDQAGDVSGASPFGDTPFSTAYNAIVNYAHSAGPNVKNYQNSATKYASEEAKAYGQNTGGEKDAQQDVYSANLPEGTKLALLSKDADYYMGRIAAMAHGGDIPGVPNDINDYLTPDARAALIKLNPEVAKKYGILPVAVSPGGGTPPGFVPPPTGPTNGGNPTPSSGFNETPDPQSAQFWGDAARNGVPYRTALQQWQSDVKQRGLAGIVPPPPGAYRKASEYIQQHPNIPYQPFSGVQRTPLAPVQQGVQQDVNNLLFNGPVTSAAHATNAALGTLPTLLAGDNGARYNAVSNALHPGYALGGDIAGTAAGAFGVGQGLEAAAPALGKFGGLIAGNPARAAMTGDALFMGGSGAAQNPDNPVGGFAIGAGSGLLGNAAGRYVVAPAARALLDTQPVQNGINAIGGMFGRGSFSPPSPLNAGQNMLLKRANGDALSGIQTNLQDAANLNLPYMMADANPMLRGLAGSAARKSPDVMQTAEGILAPRQSGQAERAIGQINANLAPVGDVPAMQAAILKNAQAQSGSLYDAAKMQPVPEITANPQLREVLDRPAAQAAIRKGYETALNNGEDVGTLTYATDLDGNPVQFGNPSWNVIHYARQALDANGDTAVRRALDKQIATLNPGFKAADAKYSGIMKGSDALQAGADATGIKVTPEATQQSLNAFPNNGPHFQQGYASNMADMIERQRLSGNPYNLINGSMAQQAKLGAVFPNGAANFQRVHALENDMGKTYQGVLGNSATASRTEADKQFDNLDIANDLVKGIATGGTSIPYDLAMTGARKFANANQVRMSMAKANAIAPYLFNPHPKANLLMLNDMIAQQAARKAYLQNFGAVTGNLGAGMFGAPILYGASGQ